MNNDSKIRLGKLCSIKKSSLYSENRNTIYSIKISIAMELHGHGTKNHDNKKNSETKMLQRRNRRKYKEKGPSLKLKTIIYPDLNRTGNSCDPTPEFFVVDTSSTQQPIATTSRTTTR